MGEEKKPENRKIDSSNYEDRVKIIKGYRKTLFNRATAPFIGANNEEILNPLQNIVDNEKEKHYNENTVDIYAIYRNQLKEVDKKIKIAMSLARTSVIISLICLAVTIFVIRYI